MNVYNKLYWQQLCLIIILYFSTFITCSIVCIEHNNPLLSNTLKHQPTKICNTLSVFEKKGTPTTTNNKIYYDLHCLDDDGTCDLVHQTLDSAINTTLKTIQLEQPLYLNVSFFSFCDQFNQCISSDNNNNSNKEVSIGQAFPSVSYLMIDKTDNTTRVYPQAILKQFTNLDSKPQWYKYDIIAQFNSDVNWFFEGSSTSIDSTQTDLLRSMLHELIHGLGFFSSWSDDLYQKFQPYVDDLPPFLTPLLLNPPEQLKKFEHDQETEKGNQPFWGFVEYPFDKFLQYQTIHLSIVTNLLANWEDANVLFNTIYDMINCWANNELSLYAQSVYQGSTTAKDITFSLPHQNGSLFTMETSLTPFSPGSSLSHVDFLNYHNGPDYLMTYLSKPGISVKELVQKFNSPNPISSKLLHILAALGYHIHPSINIKNQYKTLRPNIIFWEPPNNLVGTKTNPSASPVIVPNGPARTPSNVSNTTSTSSSSFASLSSSSYFTLLIIIYISYIL